MDPPHAEEREHLCGHAHACTHGINHFSDGMTSVAAAGRSWRWTRNYLISHFPAIAFPLLFLCTSSRNRHLLFHCFRLVIFVPFCPLSRPNALTGLLSSKLMSTLIEAIIGLIALINHLSCGTTFVGIWNRCWYWLRVAAQFAGGKKQNYIRAIWFERKHLYFKQKGKAWKYKSCTAWEQERHSLNGCDPLAEWEL